MSEQTAANNDRGRRLAEELSSKTLGAVLNFGTAIRLQKLLPPEVVDIVDGLPASSLPDANIFSFWALCHQMANHFTEPFVAEKAVKDLEHSSKRLSELRSGLIQLEKAGIAEICPVEEEYEGDNRAVSLGFILSAKFAGLIFHGADGIVRYDGISRLAPVIRHGDIEPRELFFSEKAREEIGHLSRILSREGYERACDILKAQKRNPSIQSLFYGPPGTGKTEVIRQIARQTQRDIILFDAAKVTFSAWGSTEKAYRDLFRGYRYIAEVSANPPILMMNEADQFLGSRSSRIDSSMDRNLNTISDILLEEVENMKGILLATTNLKDNIDSAFDRRFLFMTELSEPDADARMQIWKSLLKNVSDSDTRALANEYEMSGAQISNIVTRRELAELYYEGDRGLDFIRGLCDRELSEGRQHRERRIRIGF